MNYSEIATFNRRGNSFGESDGIFESGFQVWRKNLIKAKFGVLLSGNYFLR